MRHFVLVASMALVAAPAMASEQQSERQPVESLAFATIEALNRGDIPHLESVLAPSFTALDGRGGTRTRQQFLSDARATPRPTRNSPLRREWRAVHVSVDGDLALFTGRGMWRPADAGDERRATYSTLVTQHWRRTGDKWQLLVQQSSYLPPLPELQTFRSGSLELKAMVFRPHGSGPFPVIVYAHGNEPDPTDLFETVGPSLAARGYLVVAPHRRGSGLSADQGPNLLRTLTEIERTQGIAARSAQAIAALEGPHLDDMAAAVRFARSLKGADASRMFMIGNSFGGVLVMLAAERDLGLRGAANFAGTALNWDRSELFRARLTRAARNARLPLFLAQAANDFSTSPTRELGKVLQETGKPHRAKIFPEFGLTPREGHSFGVDGTHLWADEVLGFLDSGKKRTKR